MSNPLVTINLVVLNGEKYIRHFLDSVLAQTYSHKLIELNILDNGSTDNTKEIIKEWVSFDKLRIPKFSLIESKENLGMWSGQEELLKHSDGEYIITTAVDIILDKDFIRNALETMGKDEKIGALQSKIYKYDIQKLETGNWKLETKIIDTCGFQIFKSRRITNIGHGEEDKGLSFARYSEDRQFDFNKEQEIFAVEGAVPVFRKEALSSCRIKILDTSYQILNTEIVDHDYFWYGDDLDLAWRMRLFGWKQVFVPNVIAWHDRQTTKTLKRNWLDYLIRVPVRQQIPIKKRRLDWRNTRWTLIKNDYIINILKDLPWIVSREIAVLGYAVLFEPEVLKEIPIFLKNLPKMLRKRREIMIRATVRSEEIRKWFN